MTWTSCASVIKANQSGKRPLLPFAVLASALSTTTTADPPDQGAWNQNAKLRAGNTWGSVRTYVVSPDEKCPKGHCLDRKTRKAHSTLGDFGRTSEYAYGGRVLFAHHTRDNEKSTAPFSEWYRQGLVDTLGQFTNAGRAPSTLTEGYNDFGVNMLISAVPIGKFKNAFSRFSLKALLTPGVTYKAIVPLPQTIPYKMAERKVGHWQTQATWRLFQDAIPNGVELDISSDGCVRFANKSGNVAWNLHVPALPHRCIKRKHWGRPWEKDYRNEKDLRTRVSDRQRFWEIPRSDRTKQIEYEIRLEKVVHMYRGRFFRCIALERAPLPP